MSSEEKTTNAPATCCCRVEFRDGWIVANRGFESRLQETDKNILVFISICYRFPLPLELWRQITWEVLPLFRYTSWLKLSRPLKIANDICIFWGDQCTMCCMGSMFSFQPNKLRHILKFMSYHWTYICPSLFSWKENMKKIIFVIFKL